MKTKIPSADGPGKSPKTECENIFTDRKLPPSVLVREKKSIDSWFMTNNNKKPQKTLTKAWKSLIESDFHFRNLNAKATFELSSRECPASSHTNPISRRQRIKIFQQTFAQQKQKIQICAIEKH